MPFYVSCFISSLHYIEHFNILVFYNIRNTQFWICTINIVTTTTALTCFNTKKIKYRVITINISNFSSYFTFLTIHEIQLNGVVLNQFTLVKVDKNANPVKKKQLFNKPKLFIMPFFLIK